MSDSVQIADVETPVDPSMGSRLAAEVFGTFLLVFGLIATALFSSGNTGLLGPSLAIGITVIGAAYAVGHISGGHFNPAVSIGAAAAGRFAWRDVGLYSLAQVVGGALATTILLVVRAGAPEGEVPGFDAVSNGFEEHSPAGFSLLAVIVTEVVLTAVFLYVILGVTDRRAPSGFAPLAIGLTLTLIHLASIPVSNTSVNPARSIATAIYGGPDALVQLWVFIAAPIVGALIAGLTYRPLFESRR
jgi:aquaporin Z